MAKENTVRSCVGRYNVLDPTEVQQQVSFTLRPGYTDPDLIPRSIQVFHTKPGAFSITPESPAETARQLRHHYTTSFLFHTAIPKLTHLVPFLERFEARDVLAFLTNRITAIETELAGLKARRNNILAEAIEEEAADPTPAEPADGEGLENGG